MHPRRRSRTARIEALALSPDGGRVVLSAQKEAIVQSKRVPNLDDDDDDTPLPVPRAESPGYSRLTTPRPNTRDEAAAMEQWIASGRSPPMRWYSAMYE